MICSLIDLIRFMRAHAARRRRIEATLAQRPPAILVHEGLRVDVNALVAGLVADVQLNDAEALLADPASRLETAILHFARYNDRPVPGLLGVTCARCGIEYPSLRITEEPNGSRLTWEGVCPVGHPLPALPPYTVYM